ncbi:hypothetical protein SJT37_20370 [Aeromonas caviae]|uniref:hypothetical protein n=1 Tax=Aeromonas caviae TaxID=648 RepID=UPI0029D79752|nr:hypothetical protein [Aeromonas caviae]MDX7677869.1 hypothetical protein [Aeromonas caviae]
MKILKFFSLGSLLIIAINFGLALYSSMNGNYNVGYVHRMVSFIFIFVISTTLWLIVFAFKKYTAKEKESANKYPTNKK